MQHQQTEFSSTNIDMQEWQGSDGGFYSINDALNHRGSDAPIPGVPKV